MTVTILKFGGSNFLDPEGYHRVARHLAQRRATGENKIVVVVSAMKGETDSLKAQMLEVNKEASPSNLDAALAIGEMKSVCLLGGPMDLRHLRSVVVAARNGSFSAVDISKRIRELENELGVFLLDRAISGARLTPKRTGVCAPQTDTSNYPMQ